MLIKTLTGRARQLSGLPDSVAPGGVTPLLAQIQLNIQFINPWAVNSNTRGDELALVTPFDRGIPAVDVINPTPHGISMPRGSPRLKRGSLLLAPKLIFENEKSKKILLPSLEKVL